MKTKLTKMDNELLGLRPVRRCAWLPQWRWARPLPRRRQPTRSCSVHMLRGLYLWTLRTGANIVGGDLHSQKPLWKASDFNGDGTLVSPFATVNIGGTIIIDVQRIGRNLYGRSGLHGHALNHRTAPSFNIYVGPDAQQVWTTQIAGRRHGIRCRNGDTGARAIKAPRLVLTRYLECSLIPGFGAFYPRQIRLVARKVSWLRAPIAAAGVIRLR